MGLSPRIETIEAGTLTNGVKGKTTGAAIPAGYVGERIQGLQTSLQNFGGGGVYADATSVTLTPGVWILNGYAHYSLNTGTGVLAVGGGISTTSGNSASGLTAGDNFSDAPPPTGSYNISNTIPGYYVNISSTTTYYLKVVCSYSGGTPQYRGRLTAIRIA